jgi:hypothetical protein
MSLIADISPAPTTRLGPKVTHPHDPDTFVKMCKEAMAADPENVFWYDKVVSFVYETQKKDGPVNYFGAHAWNPVSKEWCILTFQGTMKQQIMIVPKDPKIFAEWVEKTFKDKSKAPTEPREFGASLTDYLYNPENIALDENNNMQLKKDAEGNDILPDPEKTNKLAETALILTNIFEVEIPRRFDDHTLIKKVQDKARYPNAVLVKSDTLSVPVQKCIIKGKNAGAEFPNPKFRIGFKPVEPNSKQFRNSNHFLDMSKPFVKENGRQSFEVLADESGLPVNDDNVHECIRKGAEMPINLDFGPNANNTNIALSTYIKILVVNNPPPFTREDDIDDGVDALMGGVQVPADVPAAAGAGGGEAPPADSASEGSGISDLVDGMGLH